jgi:hypothetical protein
LLIGTLRLLFMGANGYIGCWSNPSLNLGLTSCTKFYCTLMTGIVIVGAGRLIYDDHLAAVSSGVGYLYSSLICLLLRCNRSDTTCRDWPTGLYYWLRLVQSQYSFVPVSPSPDVVCPKNEFFTIRYIISKFVTQPALHSGFNCKRLD